MSIEYNHWSIDQEFAVKATPVIVKVIGLDGVVTNIENINHPFDRDAGMDWIVRTPDNQLYGIAARVQKTTMDKLYNSFTSRLERHTGTKTEYEKRLDAIKSGYLYPLLTLQAYFDRKTGQILSCATMKTKDLYTIFKKYRKDTNIVQERCSDNDFLFINWSVIKKLGYEINIWNIRKIVEKSISDKIINKFISFEEKVCYEENYKV